MQDNKYSFSQRKQEETDPDYLTILQEENHRLRVENAELKRSLEKEEFLHKNLYRQWTELNARILIKDRELRHTELKRSFSGNFFKYSSYALLLILIVFSFYFFSRNKNSGSSQTLTDIADPVNSATMQGREQPAEDAIKENKDTLLSPSKQVTDNESSTAATQQTTKSFDKYRVKTKTFFYNNPDESSQRNTFLLPYEGSYGILTPLDDQNGFIYVIFTNHAGRTSKGWIRKIDLDPVNQ